MSISRASWTGSFSFRCKERVHSLHLNENNLYRREVLTMANVSKSVIPIDSRSTFYDMSAVPLCVDLDGTLLRTDLLHEQLLALVSQRPLALLSLPGWLCRGRAAFKHRLAELVSLDLDILPLNEPLLEYLARERAKGREIALLS